LVAPRWGPAPEIVDPSGCFPEGLTPHTPFEHFWMDKI
jgi:hypothetical protein